MEEVTADVVEIARELQLEVETEYVIEVLHLLVNLQWMKSCYLSVKQRRWFLCSGEDAVKIIGMTKGLEY